MLVVVFVARYRSVLVLTHRADCYDTRRSSSILDRRSQLGHLKQHLIVKHRVQTSLFNCAVCQLSFMQSVGSVSFVYTYMCEFMLNSISSVKVYLIM